MRWRDGEKSWLVSQWDAEWGNSGPCGIRWNGKLAGFGERVRRLSYAIYGMNEWLIE